MRNKRNKTRRGSNPKSSLNHVTLRTHAFLKVSFNPIKRLKYILNTIVVIAVKASKPYENEPSKLFVFNTQVYNAKILVSTSNLVYWRAFVNIHPISTANVNISADVCRVFIL